MWHPRIDVGDDAVRISHVGFRAVLSRDAMASVEEIPETRFVAGIGAHGWNRRWTVNGRRRPAVRITFDVPQRGWVLGIPIRVETLDVSTPDPAALLDDLSVAAS